MSVSAHVRGLPCVGSSVYECVSAKCVGGACVRVCLSECFDGCIFFGLGVLACMRIGVLMRLRMPAWLCASRMPLPQDAFYPAALRFGFVPACICVRSGFFGRTSLFHCALVCLRVVWSGGFPRCDSVFVCVRVSPCLLICGDILLRAYSVSTSSDVSFDCVRM